MVDAYKYYWRNGTDAFEEFSLEEDFQFEQIWTDRIVTGVPETCIAEFKCWSEATGSTYFLQRLMHTFSGGSSHKAIMQAIERFGKNVIPYLRD